MKILLLVLSLTALAYGQNETCLMARLEVLEETFMQCEISMLGDSTGFCRGQCENALVTAYTDCEYTTAGPSAGICQSTTTNMGGNDATTQDMLSCVGDLFEEIDEDCDAKLEVLKASSMGNNSQPITDADVSLFCESSCAPPINALFKQRCNSFLIESLCSRDAAGYCALRAQEIFAELTTIAILSCSGSNCSDSSTTCSQAVSQLGCCSESTFKIAGGVSFILPSNCQVEECVSRIPDAEPGTGSSLIAVMAPLTIASAVVVALVTLM